MGKENLLKIIKILKLDIDFAKQKIIFEKEIRKTSILTLIAGLLTLTAIFCVNSYTNKNIEILDILAISFVVCGITTQFGDILSSNRNIEKFNFELEYKNNQLEEVNKMLEELQ